MNKDDQEFLKILNKRVNLPMIVDSIIYDPYSLTGVVNAAFRTEAIWGKFFPINEDMMLMPFGIGNREYSIEVSIESYDDVPDSVFINRIRKEIKEIMSSSEKFYFTKLTGKVKVNDEIKKLKEIVLKENPSWKPIHIEWSSPDKYVIVGKDKSHLARTTIFIANI